MSICIYKTTGTSYYYALELGMPEHAARFGEGDSPEGAALDLSDTQYQSADFGCRFPRPRDLADYFLETIGDEEIDYGSDEDDEEAEAAIAEQEDD